MLDRFPRISVTSLIASNMIPLIGVLFFDWDLFQILFLFWFESAVIGFYNVLKMLVIGGPKGIFLIIFFIFHFSGFMLGHLVFIVALFGSDLTRDTVDFSSISGIQFLIPIIIPIIALFISHGISFFSNFIAKVTYKKIDIGQQMLAPYGRVIIMHLTILFGGWLIMSFDEPVLGLVLLVVLKIIADLKAHLKEHRIG